MDSFKVGKAAREELQKSLNMVADAVGSTVGPGGRPFGFNKIVGMSGQEEASFSKDGLTVIRAIRPKDPVEKAVVEYCVKASAHSVLESGDGSSSSCVLASAVCNIIMKSDNKYPQAFARLLEKDANRAIEKIREEAITTEGAVRKVAVTSTNGDEELTDVVLEAVSQSSAYGTIVLNKNPAQRERYKISKQDGYSNCKGYDYDQTFALSADSASAYSKPMEWENPAVAIYNGDLILPGQMEPINKAFESLVSSTNHKKLVVVAFNVSSEVMNRLMVLNRTYASKGFSIFVVKPRITAEMNSPLQILRDIAAFTGVEDSKIIDGGNLKIMDQSYFGTCSKVRITGSNTFFLGRGEKHWVEHRIMQNLAIVEEAKTEFDKQITAIRNAELTEGLVTVEIGGGLMPDIHERADRFDDAQKAARACLVSGALPGAGCSYIRAGLLAEVHPDLQEALREVNKRVLENYGTDSDPTLSPEKGMTTKISEDGVVLVDAYEGGVLDACETVCSVIKNGVALGVKVATMGGFFFSKP